MTGDPTPEGAFPFARVVSACPTPEVAAANRLDPFWDKIWATGSQASWITADQAARQQEAGLGRLPAYLDLPADQAWERLTRPATMGKRLNALAVLDTWRTVTGEQAAAITGDTDLAARSRPWAELFTTGIADVGIFSNGLYSTRGTHRGTLYRPSRTNTFTKKLAPHLTYPEMVSVTGGQPWESGSQFDRHNVLAAELAIRAAEFCPVGAVVGEKLSTIELLAHSGAGFPVASGAQAAADATIVRPDGLRIAVEMTASTGASFDNKVERWAKLLSNRRLADTGLVVVFVVAPQPDKKVNAGEVLTMVKKRVAAAARTNPGVNFDRTADRMFVASWTDWFPASRHVHPSFFLLQAQRPAGAGDDLWQNAQMLHPAEVPFTPARPEIATAALHNLAMLRAVPHWLRTGTPPPLWAQQIRRAGFDGIPIPHSATGGAPLGAPQGAVGAAQPPTRLRSHR